MTIGVPSAHCAMTIAVGVNRMPNDPNGPERDSRQINGKPDDHRRQAEQRIDDDDQRAASAEAIHRQAPSRAARR